MQGTELVVLPVISQMGSLRSRELIAQGHPGRTVIWVVMTVKHLFGFLKNSQGLKFLTCKMGRIHISITYRKPLEP